MSDRQELCEREGAAIGARATDPFDTGFYFDRWQKDLRHELPSDLANHAPGDESDFYFGSFPGSNCEINFEGVLNFDGYSFGNISSPDGTLVLTQRGRIEADINVRVAIINGYVTGDITATERVVLESQAKVTGFIYTPALSVRLGAVFDGDCLLTLGRARHGTGRRSGREQYRDAEDLLVGVGV